MNKIVDEINEIAVMSDESRLKILVALFNSDLFKINGEKISGGNSYTINQLVEVTDIPRAPLEQHLNVLLDSDFIEPSKENKKYYCITPRGKKVLMQFGISEKLVMQMGGELGYNLTKAS